MTPIRASAVLALIASFAGCASLRASDDYVRDRVGSGDYLGAVALVARDGKTLLRRGYGHRDLARSEPLAPDAIFRVYSMTKLVTSVAVLQLAEDGTIGLDEPVARWLPEFSSLAVYDGGGADAPRRRPLKRPLTVRDLLIHAAGFAVGGADDPDAVAILHRAELEESPDLADYCRRLAGVPLATDPGTRFNYDGVQYVVLSRLVEAASGQPFDRHLEERIFRPLVMRDTGFAVPGPQRVRIAEMTTTDAGGKLVAPEWSRSFAAGEPLNRYPSGAGGLYSTADDFLRFGRMLLNGGELDGARILHPGSVAAMFENQLPRLDPPATEFRPGEGFGLGGYLVLDGARNGRPGSEGQFGWSGAATTYFMIDPRRRLVAMLLMQHLPGSESRAPAKPHTAFYNRLLQSLERGGAP